MSAGEPEVPEDWFEKAFGELYPILYSHRSVEAARSEARFAAETLRLAPDDRLLDLCCGAGRHLATLVEYVRHPVGLDYAPNLLAIARQRLEGRAALAHADMRAVPFQPAFDAVTNFFTSFGYFMSGEENAQVAREIARVLRPRGRFLVDHVNKEHVTRNLAPETTRQAGGYDVLERRWIDGDPPRINKRTEVSRQGQSAATLHESVQLYEPEELRMLLNEAGLVVEAMYGAYDGAPLSSRADRMILVGRRE